MEDLLDDTGVGVKPKKRTFLLILAVLVIGAYALGIFLVIDSVYSILYSGPAIVIVGVILVISSLVLRDKAGVILGSCAILGVLGIFLVIYTQEIRPHDAQFVVPVLGGICMLALVGIAIWMFSSVSRK